jgi:exonuclease 3'-5' domain-containing protein 1
MKDLFEGENVTKIIHDCRMDCDALYHHYNIKLHNVHDTSCFNDVITYTENKNLNHVLRYNGISANAERDNTVYRNNPNFWADRPLTEKMISWATSDVDKLFTLADKQLGSISGNSKTQALAKSTKYTSTARDMKVVTGLSVRNPGRFIGKGGANLRSLSNRTGTHIYQHEGKWMVFYDSETALNTVKSRMAA